MNHTKSPSRTRAAFLTMASITALGCAASIPAHAQDKPAASGTADVTQEGQLSDIVVTAQRRSETLQRVPISVQVVSQDMVVRQNLTSMVSLARMNPSIKVQGSGRSSNFYIRGTGSGESQSFDQSVGTFIDDIYHGRSRNSEATFLDLDHVEVLKGPQSTFFGNNAIAGAFNIVTKKPSDKVEGWFRGLLSPTSGENGGQYAAEGAINLPIAPELAVRVAGTFNGQKGYLRNVNTGKRAPDQDNYAFRGTLRYTPDENLDIVLKGELGRSVNKGGLVLRQTSCAPPSPFTAAGFCALNLADKAPTGLDNSDYTSNAGNETRLTTREAVLTIDQHFGDSTLTSVTGYNKYSFNIDLDNDGTGRQLLNVQAPERYEQFSQELRFASATGRPLEFLGGLYFQADRLRIQQSVGYFFLTPNLQSVSAFAPLLPYLPIGQLIDATQKERVYSAFGSLTWNASAALKLSASLRGSIVTKDFDWQLQFGTAAQAYGGIVPLPASLVPLANRLGIGTAGIVALDRNDKALMPSARIQYQFDRDVMAYASYSRGFKAGGFSVADVTAVPGNYPFDPEHVNAYEIGLKSEFFNRSLLVNLAAFRNDFSDLQVVIQGTNGAGALINFVRNAAASRSQGIELETQWIIAPIFRLAASGTYLDSKYRRYQNAGPTYAQQIAGQTTQDLSGRSTLYAPKWSGSVTGTLTVPVTSNYSVTAEATGIFSSSFQTYSTLDPLTLQPAYARLDARLSFEPTGGRWGVDIIGKNLTNTVIRTFSGYQPTSRGSLYQDRQQFRNIAFQFRYKF